MIHVKLKFQEYGWTDPAAVDEAAIDADDAESGIIVAALESTTFRFKFAPAIGWTINVQSLPNKLALEHIRLLNDFQPLVISAITITGTDSLLLTLKTP